MPSHPDKVDQATPHPSGGGYDDLRTPIWADDIPDNLWAYVESSMADQKGRRLIQKVRFKLQETQAKSVNAHTVLSLICANAAIQVVRGPNFTKLWDGVERIVDSAKSVVRDIKTLEELKDFYDIPNEQRVLEIIRKENEAMETRILAAINKGRESAPPEATGITHFKKDEKGKTFVWTGSGEPESGDGEWIPQTFKNWTPKS